MGSFLTGQGKKCYGVEALRTEGPLPPPSHSWQRTESPRGAPRSPAAKLELPRTWLLNKKGISESIHAEEGVQR